jgi:iron complex transport system substrate-binding protein
MTGLPLLTNASRLVGLAGLLLAGGVTFALCAAQGAPGEGADKSQRIVSLNLCTDEMVLRLAERRHIASVTWLSLNPENSNVAPLAQGIPINHGLAEEVIPLMPDLVMAGIYTARPAVNLLRRAGLRTMDVGLPRTFDEVRRQYREVAATLGEQANGARVVAEMDERLAKATVASPTIRPRALVLNPNGYTVGRGSLLDEIITRAGLENVAATLGLGEYGQLPLEVVAMSRIDVLIVSSSRDGPPALATDMLRHPVLSRLSDRTQVVVVPNRLWNCNGPELVEVVERLARAGAEVRRKVARE